MKALAYDRLNLIRKTEKPFRGTTNRFPIGNRRHNTKCFYVTERDGEEVFEITYGMNYDRVSITKEEFDEDPTGCYRYLKSDGNNQDEYWRYNKYPHIIGIVRADNTFEFTSETSTGQGSNSIMSSWSTGWFLRSSRHGGMIYREGYHKNPDRLHPIFKGLRLHMDTMLVHESSKYVVTGYRVNRSKAKDFLARYVDFYKVSEVMLKTMQSKDIVETARSLIDENGIKREGWWSMKEEDRTKLICRADRVLNDAPLDAALMFGIAYDVNKLTAVSLCDDNSYYMNTEIEGEVLFSNLKRKINKELYRKHREVFDTVEYQPNYAYPPSEWGVTITVNGVEVEQY